MYCKKCGKALDEDALFCKYCGHNLIEDYEEEYANNDTKSKKPKNKTTNKTKNKTKEKNRNKTKNVYKNKKGNNTVEKKNSFFQSLLIFILIILVLGLLGAVSYVGYNMYKEKDTEVPDLVGLSYEEAAIIVASNDLKIEKKIVEVDNEDDNNIVLKQNKKANKKVSKNTTIKVTVGIYEEEQIISNYIGMDINNVISDLETLGILYKITYEVSDNDGIVLEQTPSVATKINENTVVKLVVSQKEEEPESDKTIIEDENKTIEEAIEQLNFKYYI